eukprot:6181855-Pleurochrysis_carterae.AAC.2
MITCATRAREREVGRGVRGVSGRWGEGFHASETRTSPAEQAKSAFCAARVPAEKPDERALVAESERGTSPGNGGKEHRRAEGCSRR